jgi:hypothetical protein
LVKFAKFLRTVGDGGLVQKHLTTAKDSFRIAFPEACLLGYELCDGHAGVSHSEMSLSKSQAPRYMVPRTAEGHGSLSGLIERERPYPWEPSGQRGGLVFPGYDGFGRALSDPDKKPSSVTEAGLISLSMGWVVLRDFHRHRSLADTHRFCSRILCSVKFAVRDGWTKPEIFPKKKSLSCIA